MKVLAAKAGNGELWNWLQPLRNHLYWLPANTSPGPTYKLDMAKGLASSLKHVIGDHTMCVHAPHSRRTKYLEPGEKSYKVY